MPTEIKVNYDEPDRHTNGNSNPWDMVWFALAVAVILYLQLK